MWLKAWLIREGRKQAWLAEKLDVSASLISHWLAGRRVPSQEQQEALMVLTRGAVTPGDWRLQQLLARAKAMK